MMGRLAAYTGQTITREDVFNSQEDLSPAEYTWSDLEPVPVPVPGINKFF